jgi:hypothetical protein
MDTKGAEGWNSLRDRVKVAQPNSAHLLPLLIEGSDSHKLTCIILLRAE